MGNPCDDCMYKDSGQCSCERLEKYELYIKTYNQAINKFVANAIKEFQKFDKEHGYPTLGDISVILCDVAEKMK